MLDPEGDQNPTLPGDGAAPPNVPWPRYDCTNPRRLTTGALLAHAVDVLDALVERGVPLPVHRLVIHRALHDAAWRVKVPASDEFSEAYGASRVALVALAQDYYTPCPVCHDIGAVGAGRPCPTGCNASTLINQEPEPAATK